MSDRGFGLTGRTALVTGSSAGIGLGLARALGRAGARVVLNGRDPARLDAARATLAAERLEVSAAPFDVLDAPDALAAQIAAIEDAAPLDILINNAGIQRRGALESFPPETFDEVIATNLTAAFRVGQAVARGMIARRRGVIVNVCSVQSELTRPGIAPYAASKGGLKMLTKGMATDWGPHGIRVNGLAPGYFRTELNAALAADAAFSGWLENRTPLRRWGEVGELGGPAVFLCSDAASFVTGHILYVDGGVTACL
ncbi:SDR family oxidoreductase [Paracoccus luteus]|uniref:SDR family oxidoreductase n=1 Tax=Paracoccus luteus TaxID=2508543 RepID=UPI00106F75AD|nr:SDR family oxidoreductase [Paracoccus luteus]